MSEKHDYGVCVNKSTAEWNGGRKAFRDKFLRTQKRMNLKEKREGHKDW